MTLTINPDVLDQQTIDEVIRFHGHQCPGLAIGMIQAINEGGAYGLGSTWSQSVVFIILIILMVFKPEGLFGRPTTEKV